MKKHICTLLFVLLLGFFGNAQSVIEANLQDIIDYRSDDMISINIILKSQIQPEVLRDMASRTNDNDVKKEIIIDKLKEHSSKEQAEVLSILNAERRNNNVSDINCHWLVNSINCMASRDVIYLLAEHPAVSMIGYNENIKAFGNIKTEKTESTRGVASHVSKVNAEKVWNMGYTGKGVVVAVLDTGTNFDHTDINSANLWDGGTEYPYHGYNVINPTFAPYDDHGHGSHCAGIVCGTGVSGAKTGIAPDATLMTVKVADGDGMTSLDYMITGIEFAIENGADVLSISIGWQKPDVSVSTSFREIFENTLELGVLSSIAAGNDGDEIVFYPVPKNINSPGNCPPAWLHPDQEVNAGGLSGIISVGAVQYNDNVANFSSQGPVTWTDSRWNDYPYSPEIGLIRPDICAPGEDIVSLSHLQNNGYLPLSGTSMAAPCVTGVIALMLEKNPDLTPSDLCRLIETTAVKLSDKKNNSTGSGRIDAFAAINGGKEIPYLNFASINPEVSMPGNNKELIINLINNGDVATIGNTNVTLSTDDSYVTIVNGNATLGSIEPGKTASGTFKINISANAPIGHVIDFKIEMTYNDGEEDLHFIDNCSLNVGSAPYIRYKSCSPEMLSSFEAIDFNVTMFNNGNVATTDNTVVTLSTMDQYLTVIDNEATYGPMSPNESKSGTFSVVASQITPDGHTFDMTLKTVLTNNYSKQNITYDFDDGTSNGWTNIDNDGDGYLWIESIGLLGEGCGYQSSRSCMFSQSYSNDKGGIILYPDNYFVSPMKILVEEGTELRFWARAHDRNYPSEHFGVAVSEKSNNKASDFTTIAEWTMTAKSGQASDNKSRQEKTREEGTWYLYSVNLEEYVGKEIWLAIRHFNCHDQFYLAVDNIEITNINLPISWEEHFTLKFHSIYPNIALDSYTPDILHNGDNNVDITVINNGTDDLTQTFNVMLSSDSQFVTIDNNNVEYPPMNIGDTQTKSFNINISPTAPNGQVVEFKLEASPDDNAETDITFNFNTDMNGWTIINSNNDQHTWYHSSDYDTHNIVPVPSHSGYGHIMSESYCNATYQALFPDDYIVSPMMIEVTENTKFSFWAASQDEAYCREHFGVAISTKSNDIASDFTTIDEWTLETKSGQRQETRNADGTRYGQWHQYNVNLSEYVGQKIWIAIRHFNSNEFCLSIDDIEISNFIKVYDWKSTFTMTVANDNIAPKNLKATAIDNSAIELVWEGIDNATTYNIYRNNEFLCNATACNYIDNEVTETIQYCYSVTCIIDGEESGHSNTACATTQNALPECSAPSNIFVDIENDTYGFKYLINLSWESIPNAMSYVLYANKNFIGVVQSPSFMTGSNADGTVIYNIATNCGEDGSSEMSEDIVIVLGNDDEICKAPNNLKATVEEYAAGFANAFKVTLTWNSVTEANSYNLYVNNNLFKENITSNSYVLGSDTEGSYTFKVTSNCDNGESDMSLSYTVKLEHIGINEYSGNIELYPNPVNSKLYIECQEAIEDVCIFNVTGVMVYHEYDLKDNEIDMSDFSEGLYIIKIKTNNYNIVKRFIKK